MALNVNQGTNQTYLSNCTQSQQSAAAAPVLSTFGAVQRRAERPTTLFKLSLAAAPTSNGGSTTNGGATSQSTAGTAAAAAASAANLSPFDEQEEWAKISEIMATFGTDAIQDSVFATDEERRRAHQATIARRTKLRLSRALDGGAVAAAAAANGAEQQHGGDATQTMAEWLDGVALVHLEPLLRRNGFDDVAYLVSC